MAIIVPAILEQTKEDFIARAQNLERVTSATRMQVDFADGKFVPNTTVSVQDLDSLNPAYFWEAHLMVEEPVDFFDYQMLGFGVIIVHFEAFVDTTALERSLAAIRGLGMKTGLALNPETPVSVVIPFDHLVDQYTLLTIHPGFQGQDLLAGSLERVTELKRLVPGCVAEVDGGVSARTIAAAARAGADILVVGSALKQNPVRAYEDLQSALAEGLGTERT